MGTHDPLLRMSDHQYRDLHGVYADPLGWPARAAIGVAALLVGAGCGALLVAGGVWRRVAG